MQDLLTVSRRAKLLRGMTWGIGRLLMGLLGANYSDVLLLCLQEKRKAGDSEEGTESDRESTPEPTDPATSQAAAADLEGMKKAMMTRKDRNLYQSILNRQKAKKQKVEKLEQRKAAAKAKKAKRV